ncbi:MAG: XdhC family protein, partial [Chloroflexota bacterium]
MTADTLGSILQRARQLQQNKQAAAIVTLVADRTGAPAEPGARMLVEADGTATGGIGPKVDAILLADALDQLTRNRSELHSYELQRDGARKVKRGAGDLDVFFEVIGRPPRIIVAGAGHIAVPLIHLAALLDFETIVLDD